MPIKVTTKGYIEVYRGNDFVSRHRVETEAFESVVTHSEANGDGVYELRFPVKEVAVSRLDRTYVATDTTAPLAPSGITAQALSKTQILVEWTAVTDPSGVTYSLERGDGTSFSVRTTQTGLQYTDTVPSGSTYHYRVRAYDSVPNYSAYSPVAQATTPSYLAPDWLIPDTPYNLAPAAPGQVASISGTYAANDGTPAFTVLSATKADLTPVSVTIDPSTGAITAPTTTDAGYVISLDLADATLADAESDWIARSTAPGVVWAHDFRNAAEVENFIDVDPSVTTTVYDPTPAFTGGTVDHVIPGNVPSTISSITSLGANSLRVVTTSPLDLTTSDTVRFFNLPAPWDGFNDSLNGGSGLVESWTVTAVNSATSFDLSAVSFRTDLWPSINTTGFSAYSGPTSATAQRCRNSRGSWNRPMSALLAGGNGLTSNDPGIANLGMPGRTWDPVYNANRHYRYRADWYGHADYAARIATWPDWSGASQSDQYRGSDFWVQWRIKISASRYQASAAAIRNSSGLKYFAMWATGPSTPLHEIVWSDYNTPNAPYANYAASDGGIVSGYTGAGYSMAFNDGGSSMQGGGDFASTCVWTGNYPASPTACFNIVPDEWYVFLLHVIPGKQVSNWSGWPNSADATLGTGIQLWGASQSRIDAMVAAGQRATYQKIYDKVGSTAFPFQYDNWNPSAYNSANPPPAWNNVMFWTYQNNLPQAYGWTRKLTQVIFKKGNGAQNQTLSVGSINPETDGIPCPQV